MLAAGRMPHFIFYGASGTGKTTLAKKISADFTTMQLNASDDKGIDIVRNKIKEFCETATMDRFKYIVLDEVDAMTPDAQMALLRMMEQYTFNCRFCLICNYITSLIPPLLSRCVLLHFYPPSNQKIAAIAPAASSSLIDICDRDLRKILHYSSAAIKEADLYAHCNKVAPEVMEEIIGIVARERLLEGLRQVEEKYGMQELNVQYMYWWVAARGKGGASAHRILYKYYRIDHSSLRFFLLCLYELKK